MIKSSAIALAFVLMTLTQASNASSQWETACAHVGNSAGWCNYIYHTVAGFIVEAEERGVKFNHPAIEISFGPWNPRSDAAGTPIGILSFSDGRVRCKQPMTGYHASGRLTCKRH